MLRIAERELAASAQDVLWSLQQRIDAIVDYADAVDLAGTLWDRRNTVRHSAAFRAIRTTLATMCVGPVRCAYCEDSAADEIEHILPKSLFPQQTFIWGNYAFVCGPCNGPKNNRYGVVVNGIVVEFVRRRRDRVVPPPAGQSGFIHPRVEDPTTYIEMDLGGVTPDGSTLDATFEFVPVFGMAQESLARAQFTIRVLGLNRELLLVARRNAYDGFRARLLEYAISKEAGAPPPTLERIKNSLLGTPHLTVFHEMRRQRTILPEIAGLFARVVDALEWPLVPV
jgi:hypothetical protein